MDNLILIAAVGHIECLYLFDRQLKNKDFSHSKRRCFLAVDRAKIGVLWGSQHLNIIRFEYT
jgi:hypothetical protein